MKKTFKTKIKKVVIMKLEIKFKKNKQKERKVEKERRDVECITTT